MGSLIILVVFTKIMFDVHFCMYEYDKLKAYLVDLIILLEKLGFRRSWIHDVYKYFRSGFLCLVFIVMWT